MNDSNKSFSLLRHRRLVSSIELKKITYQLCHCATCIGAVGILLACGQELGCIQGKAGRRGVNWRRNVRILVGTGV
jgi:hypothetical protein